MGVGATDVTIVPGPAVAAPESAPVVSPAPTLPATSPATIAGPAPTPPPATGAPRPSRVLLGVGIAGLATGLVGAGLGAWFVAHREGQVDMFNQGGDCTAYGGVVQARNGRTGCSSLYDQGAFDQAAAITSFAVGGALLVSGVITLALYPGAGGHSAAEGLRVHADGRTVLAGYRWEL